MASAMVEEAVTSNHIAQIVSRWTGVPVDRMLEGERDKLLRMEDEIAKRVVGQAEAVHAVSTAVRRARAGLAGSEPADRLVHVSWAHRRRQNRTDEGARAFYVRRRERAPADRHVGIHGEAFGLPPDRRASGLCRLRRGRRAHRSRPPPALSGRSCSTRSKKRIPMSSTCCCRCWTKAA